MKKIIILFSIIFIIIGYFYIADTFYKKGNENFEKGIYDLAIENYKIALKLTPTKNIIYSNLGDTYFKIKDYDKSIESYNKFLLLNPELENITINLFKTKEFIEKNNELLEFLEYYNSYIIDAYKVIGYSEYYKGNYSISIEKCNKSLEILEKYKLIYLHIYDVYKKENIVEKMDIYKNKISEYENNINLIKLDIEESNKYLNIRKTSFLKTLNFPKLKSNNIIKERIKLENNNDIIKQDVNLRKSPSINSDIISIIIKNENVEKIGELNVGGQEWYKVNYKGTEGWISGVGFVVDPNAKSLADFISYEDEKLGDYYVNSEKVYFWEDPNLNKTSKYLLLGQKVKIIKLYSNFGFGIFTNESGITTSGWLPLSDLNYNNYIKETDIIGNNSNYDNIPIIQAKSNYTGPLIKTNLSNTIYVDSYTKSDGTYVSGHNRTKPNNTKSDNLGCIFGGKCN